MMTPLEILEQGHDEAVAALEALKMRWVQDDADTAKAREAMLEAHAQGDRDRDAKRVQLGGESLIEAERRAKEAAQEKARLEADEAKEAAQRAAAEAKATKDAEAARKAAEPPRASSLPVTPLASLGQGPDETS